MLSILAKSQSFQNLWV
ncbi:hypothetical protein JMJ77_0003102 [Colletotrichum scovillei]|uniref:Uncharacterized protein n=1 Tax=Colletotrichum scovillei TaxID=1209932 RepID=A0A9P7QWM7_9PEZI|nr:hypothetical protein JMJ78_0006312 [Colletotrichum scovillei]KAG7043396.1 hypothetical protein JMJ77_0003102 [Colletotrichum scovillei]KAG7062847.1 hypothetical protein JMJ76_0009690 [Colletotrichum scovillei]